MSESLRDQLEANYDKIVSEEPQEPAEQPKGTDTSPVSTPPEAVSADPEKKQGRLAGRERDELGRVLPGPAKRPEVPQAQVPPVEQKPRPPRPSSWKKEYWDHWEKIDPTLADYLHQREGEFAKGVSTYKQEWERAKPLLDAIAPHQAMFQQYGIDPAQQISKYVEIHKGLAMGSHEQKLGMLLKIAQDYQIPLQNLFVRGQDGQVYFNPQVQQHQPAQQQQQQPAQDIDRIIDQRLASKEAEREAAAMESDTEKYPHFVTVKATMAGILQAGLAQDLQSAYQAALRMPQHSDIWDAMQQQQREQDEKEKAEASRKAVEAARRNNVSPKSVTPQGTTPNAKKGLRATLEDAFDQHVSGRV